jgi:hypothetical protein
MTAKAQVLKAIRKYCVECSAGSRSEVARCHLTNCPLWTYRFGTDPDTGPARGAAKRVLPRGSSEQETAFSDQHCTQKESPPEVAASDGSQSKTLTGEGKVIDDEKDS